MTDIERDQETRLQDAARRLVDREVIQCVSSLVCMVAQGYGDHIGNTDLAALTEQAYELSSPVQDYEEAAREDGWTEGDDGMWNHPDHGEATDAQDACYLSNTDPHDREVFEHWTVSRWLADKLEARGEKVDRDFAGLIVWARTTTGQAILLDGVIRDIVRELGWDKETTHA